MKVARYEVPGKRRRQIRPVGNGVIRSLTCIYTTFCNERCANFEKTRVDLGEE
jgi:hypothetical protein